MKAKGDGQGTVNAEDTSDRKIYLDKKLLDEMIQHARRDYPNECCGVIAGKEGKAVRIYPTCNEEKSPVRYRIPAQELFEALKDIESRSWYLIGMYHSHTHTEAYPSPTDVRLAFWPETLYLIVSLTPPSPTVRAFRIVEGAITEIDIEIL